MADNEQKQDSIYAAVAKAMGEVTRLGKDNKNAEQKYDFTSVDDFLAMVGPICAKNGLVTVANEVGVEFTDKPGKYGNTLWVFLTYEITTYHVSGASLPPVQRHIEVIRSGSTAYGSAQSYVLKQYYRGLFCIPTGDKDDPDHGTTAEVEGSGNHQPKAKQPAKPADNSKAIEYLTEATDLDDLKARWTNMPDAARRDPAVIAAKDKTKDALTADANHDKAVQDEANGLDDAIPY